MRGALPKYDQVELDKIRWPNFTSAELGCRNGNYPNRTKCRFCGGDYYHSPEFLDKAQAMRNALGHAVHFNSAHRCRRSELAVGGSMNEHRRIAGDVLILNNDRHEMLNVARDVGFTGVGKYRGFIHLDIRTVRKGEWFGRGAERFWNV